LRTTITLLAAIAALSGCAQPKMWSHTHGNQPMFYADKLACEQMANGMVPDAPPPAPVQAPVAVPNAYQTNCVAIGYSVNCNTTANQSAQLEANMAAQGYNAGAQAGYGISQAVAKMNRERVFDDCMRSKGYTQQSAPVTSTSDDPVTASTKMEPYTVDLAGWVKTAAMNTQCGEVAWVSPGEKTAHTTIYYLSCDGVVRTYSCYPPRTGEKFVDSKGEISIEDTSGYQRPPCLRKY